MSTIGSSLGDIADGQPISETTNSPRVSALENNTNDEPEQLQKQPFNQGNVDYSAVGLDHHHWGHVNSRKRSDYDARSIASSMNAEKDDKSIYEEPTIGAVAETDEHNTQSESDEDLLDPSGPEGGHEREHIPSSDISISRTTSKQGSFADPTGSNAASPRQGPSYTTERTSLAPESSDATTTNLTEDHMDTIDLSVGVDGGGGETISNAASQASMSERGGNTTISTSSIQDSIDTHATVKESMQTQLPSSPTSSLNSFDAVNVMMMQNSAPPPVAATPTDDDDGNKAAASVPQEQSAYQSRLMQSLTGEEGKEEEEEDLTVCDHGGEGKKEEDATTMAAAAAAMTDVSLNDPDNDGKTTPKETVPSEDNKYDDDDAAPTQPPQVEVSEVAASGELKPKLMQNFEVEQDTKHNNNNHTPPPVPPYSSSQQHPQPQHAVAITEVSGLGPVWEETFQGLVYCDGVDSLGRSVVVLNADVVPPRMKSAALTYVRARIEPIVAQGDYVLLVTAEKGVSLPTFWVLGAYQGLPRPFRKNVQYIVMVKPSGFLRAIISFMRPFVSKKAARKIKLLEKVEDVAEATDGEVTLQHLGAQFGRLHAAISDGAGASP